MHACELMALLAGCYSFGTAVSVRAGWAFLAVGHQVDRVADANLPG